MLTKFLNWQTTNEQPHTPNSALGNADEDGATPAYPPSLCEGRAYERPREYLIIHTTTSRHNFLWVLPPLPGQSSSGGLACHLNQTFQPQVRQEMCMSRGALAARQRPGFIGITTAIERSILSLPEVWLPCRKLDLARSRQKGIQGGRSCFTKDRGIHALEQGMCGLP